MNKLLKGITVVFFLFILWIIFSADTGRKNMFFEIVDMIPYGDKLGHFFLFGVLALLLNVALKFKPFKLWQRLPLGSVLVFAFAFIEELSQGFLPNRNLDAIDLVADSLGIIVFTLLGYVLFKNRTLEVNKLD